MRPRWGGGPEEITLVRHAHSLGNLADHEARESGADRLDLDVRDADVELSPTGRDQVDDLVAWVERLDEDRRPTLVVSSPYRRALDTAVRAAGALGLEPELDERLRERDLGVFDGLTGQGVRSLHPEEAARRAKLGKFWFQPPGGESWADVALRVRSLLQDLRSCADGSRVWLFSHQAVIMTFRYVLEGLSEQQVLELDREVRIPNASVTTFRRREGVFVLESFADAVAVEAGDAAVTAQAEQSGRP